MTIGTLALTQREGILAVPTPLVRVPPTAATALAKPDMATTWMCAAWHPPASRSGMVVPSGSTKLAYAMTAVHLRNQASVGAEWNWRDRRRLGGGHEAGGETERRQKDHLLAHRFPPSGETDEWDGIKSQRRR